MSRGCPEFMSAQRPLTPPAAPGRLGGNRGPGASLALAGRAGRRASTSCQAHHPLASVRRAVAPRHLRHEAAMPPTASAASSSRSPPASPGSSVTEHLPRFATVIDRFAQIRSVNHRMKNHNSATYYSLTGHAPPIDDIRLRDTQELYPAYGSTVAKLKPAEDPSVPSFVSYPYVCATAASPPVSTRAFWARRSTRSSSRETRINRASGSPS